MALSRCLLLKESSRFDETVENGRIRRMALFMLVEPHREKGHACMRLFSTVSSFLMIASAVHYIVIWQVWYPGARHSELPFTYTVTNNVHDERL